MNDDDIGCPITPRTMRREIRRAFGALRRRWRAIREGRAHFAAQPRCQHAGLLIGAEIGQQLCRVWVVADLRRIRFHAARA